MKHDKRILIIEDDADDEALLVRQLKQTEFAWLLHIVRDGGQALSYLTDERFKCGDFAAVFLDLRLPSINGLAILGVIRSSEHLKHLPVIVMTAASSPKDFARCRELGVSIFVEKPLTFSSFTQALADALDDAPRVDESSL